MTPKQREEYQDGFIKHHCENDEDGLRIYESGDVGGIMDYWLNIIKQREEELVRKIDAKIRHMIENDEQNDVYIGKLNIINK